MARPAFPDSGPSRSLRGICVALGLVVTAAAAATDDVPTYDHGRLWRVSRTGVADSYVLGTIHIADERVASIPPPVAEALARSRTLYMEVVPGPAPAEFMDGFEVLPDGARLEPLIGSAAYSLLHDELARQGMRDATIATLKPWAAMLRITQLPSVPGARSLDENLYAAARSRRMNTWSLESAEEQSYSFDAVPLDTQVALLEHILARRDLPLAESEAAIADWLGGDLGALARLPFRAGQRFPALRVHYERLVSHIIHDRTALLHHRLFFPLRSGRAFIAVGAAHLQGRLGLLAMLRRDGYRVTLVWR